MRGLNSKSLLAAMGLVLCALIAGLTVLPARWLLLISPAGAPIGLADAQGSLWEGRAWIALGPPDSRRLLPEPLQWRVRWARLDIEATHPWLQGPLVIAPRLDGIKISAQGLRAPAAAMAALGAPWNTLSPGGLLDMRWQALTLGRPMSGPVAQIRWQDASTALSPLPRIGAYVMRIQGNGKDLTLALSTESGVLQADGQGIANQHGVRFAGRLSYAANADAAQRRALDGLLAMIGPRQGDTVSFGTPGAAMAP
ncbi:type II secretion system protein N [Bordetella avium]|uniref:type II secretion system protein N n=1 Tax=Bordetella avium TaxID=521 RepID=UPI000E68537C|nr:type II secretion system protein N [Bordetella avium]AZY51368.1 general secretion pathway protein GspN [Bordetella avium]RIQ41242.1 general secretion pathway protein GspN [Bordetella avium]RIQ45970.1 general secretion pathway protein GspN [Bordetella avium]RIQ46897.1 general secretion pathway protein GspN [Bordetella avium]RIQ50684.1 general secretion pathway protein GspN [Bordetella avium]